MKLLNALRSLFLALWYCFPRTPGIRYYRHRDNAFLYILASEKYIKPGEERKFRELFEKAIPCSLFRFNFILFYYEIQPITVADDEIMDEFHPEERKEISERDLQAMKKRIQEREHLKKFVNENVKK